MREPTLTKQIMTTGWRNGIDKITLNRRGIYHEYSNMNNMNTVIGQKVKFRNRNRHGN